MAEFLRYAGVAWSAAALNYGLFVAILLVRSGTEPLVALVVSSAAAMVLRLSRHALRRLPAGRQARLGNDPAPSRNSTPGQFSFRDICSEGAAQ